MKVIITIVAIFIAATTIPAPPACTGEEVLQQALRDEMVRSVEQLQLEDLERPYYIEYRVDDVRGYIITASFGSLVRSQPTKLRALTVDVRVGDQNLDNSEFISTDMFRSGRFSQASNLPLKDDYYPLRRALWLETDRAYKIALEVLAKKRAQKENQIEDEPVPDFSYEEPNVHLADVLSCEFDAPAWEKLIKELSGIFRKFPEIQESKVELRFQHLVRYYINSEGSEYRKTEPAAIVYATARTQADDGAVLKDYVRMVMPTPGDMPEPADIEAAVRQMAEELTALRSAPVVEDYTGPVLFGGIAAADLMVEAVGRQCIGQRPPESDMPQISQMMPSPKLAERIGRRGASDVVSVFDDPGTREYNGKILAGWYEVDDQGVPAKKVTLIENGTVKSLLMSRRPRKEIPQSNGHARMPVYGVIGSDASIGNLYVQSSESVSFETLKDELVDVCNDEGLEFGLLVLKLNDELLTGVDLDSPEAMMSMYQRMGGITVGAPVVAYRIYAKDGREELIRGLDMININIRSLRDILAMGDDTDAYNVLVASGGGLFGGGGSQGIRVSNSVPAAVITPSVLFEEFELKAKSGARKKPAILAHPSFAK